MLAHRTVGLASHQCSAHRTRRRHNGSLCSIPIRMESIPQRCSLCLVSPGHPLRRGAPGEPNGDPRAPHKAAPRNKNVRGARARRDARPIARSLGCRTSDRGRRRLRKDASASSRVTWATNKRSLDRTTLAPARDPAEPPGPPARDRGAADAGLGELPG